MKEDIVKTSESRVRCDGGKEKLGHPAVFLSLPKGGEVIWLGKPHLPIYDTGFSRLQKMTNMEKPRILAIGDGFKTDIPGANAANLDVLFITGGLSETLTQESQTPEGEAMRDDENFTFVSAWGYNGEPSKAKLQKEQLDYEEIEVKTRSYK